LKRVKGGGKCEIWRRKRNKEEKQVKGRGNDKRIFKR